MRHRKKNKGSIVDSRPFGGLVFRDAELATNAEKGGPVQPYVL